MEAIGDISLDADEVGDAAVAVAHGGDGKFVPEGSAVFAVIFESYFAIVLFLQGDADLIEGVGIGIRALQEAAVSPDRFGDRVACNLLKGWIAVDYGLVWVGSVGDRNAVAGSCQGAIVQPPDFFD